MGLRMKNDNIFGGSLKNPTFREVHKKPKQRGELSKKEVTWIVCSFEEGGDWQERQGGVFEGGLIPQCTLSWVDQENLILCQMRQNQKLCIKMKKVIDRGKRSNTLSEVKPVKRISKNPQSFPEISLMQREVLPSHKLQNHAYE